MQLSLKNISGTALSDCLYYFLLTKSSCYYNRNFTKMGSDVHLGCRKFPAQCLSQSGIFHCLYYCSLIIFKFLSIKRPTLKKKKNTIKIIIFHLCIYAHIVFHLNYLLNKCVERMPKHGTHSKGKIIYKSQTNSESTGRTAIK